MTSRSLFYAATSSLVLHSMAFLLLPKGISVRTPDVRLIEVDISIEAESINFRKLSPASVDLEPLTESTSSPLHRNTSAIPKQSSSSTVPLQVLATPPTDATQHAVEIPRQPPLETATDKSGISTDPPLLAFPLATLDPKLPPTIPKQLRTLEEVKAEIQENAQRVMREDRVARGMVERTTLNIGDLLEHRWTVTPRDVRSWPIRPEIRHETLGSGPDSRDCPYRYYRVAELLIELDQDGYVANVDLIRRSGSKSLDRSMEELIQSVAPFPTPPSSSLNSEGRHRSRWQIALRYYSGLSCGSVGGDRIVKEIQLLDADDNVEKSRL